mmetsp:Transcript_17146/g.25377  ORF Transcript_17146/g.25377 Transcript_17146/m.25377 type:complete len:207 (+) Transcript_17146:99-719(+)
MPQIVFCLLWILLQQNTVQPFLSSQFNSSSKRSFDSWSGFLRASKFETRIYSEISKESTDLAEWDNTGRKGRVLVRKKDIPSPEYSSFQVCEKVLLALQLNDDPILDYGAAVAIKFASSSNEISKLLPNQYGDYLRASEFEILIDNSNFNINSELEIGSSGKKCVHRVEIKGPPPAFEMRSLKLQLSKESLQNNSECWMIDSISTI